MAHRCDQWHAVAMRVSQQIGTSTLMTTDEIFDEFLSHFSAYGGQMRAQAVRIVRDLLNDPTVTVIPQSRQTFFAGLTLYEARPDKEYSLTDCISMATMRQEGITEVLTHDDHFAQEGFVCLL